MPVLPLVITLLACADTVEQELFDAELDNRDLQLSTLSARLDTLEATVSAQADLISAQDAALTALGQSLSADDAALAARIDAVEARDDAQDDALDGLDGEVAVIGAAVEGLASDAEGVAGELALLGVSVSDLTSRAGVLETAQAMMATSLSAIDTTGLDTRITALEDAADAAGETWSTGGTGVAYACLPYTASWVSLGTLSVAPSSTNAVAFFAAATVFVPWRIVVTDGAGRTVATSRSYTYLDYAGTVSVPAAASMTYVASLQVYNNCSSTTGYASGTYSLAATSL